MSTLFVGHFVQFFDDNGDPLSGGSVEFFEPGTSTPKDIYTDSDLATPASNPVTLDAAGRATVWLNGDYKARLEDSTGSLVEETDNINPAITTATTGGNLVANGSFETQGNASTEADGWTLTAQSDGTVERITADNYDGEASLKFTSLGNGGGQADTDSFFAVSPGRQYEVSFALKCSVADIRNIVQVRYFDEDQSFLSNSSVYDEDTSNPTSWTLKSFSDTPPSNARFAKLRILGADQSDATAGEAKFDNVVFGRTDTRFPNVNADVTATDEELNATPVLLFGFPGFIDGLITSNNGTDSDHDIDITTGVCSMRDSSGGRKMFELTSSLTKQIDANWAEGSDAGGFPSGLTLSSNTWYRVFVIGKDDGSVDAGFDTDSGASNLLTDASSYSWLRRIGWVRTDGSNNITAFSQDGDEFLWNTPVNDIDNSNPGTSAVLAALMVPGETRALTTFSADDITFGGRTDIIITSPDQSDTAPSIDLFDLQLRESSDEPSVHKIVRTNSSSQIRYRFSSSTADHTFKANTFGWVDNRGRDQ